MSNSKCDNHAKRPHRIQQNILREEQGTLNSDVQGILSEEQRKEESVYEGIPENS